MSNETKGFLVRVLQWVIEQIEHKNYWHILATIALVYYIAYPYIRDIQEGNLGTQVVVGQHESHIIELERKYAALEAKMNVQFRASMDARKSGEVGTTRYGRKYEGPVWTED